MTQCIQHVPWKFVAFLVTVQTSSKKLIKLSSADCHHQTSIIFPLIQIQRERVGDSSESAIFYNQWVNVLIISIPLRRIRGSLWRSVYHSCVFYLQFTCFLLIIQLCISLIFCVHQYLSIWILVSFVLKKMSNTCTVYSFTNFIISKLHWKVY